MAARVDAAYVARVLIENRCPVDSLDHAGRTPLHVACESNAVNTIVLLLAEDNSLIHIRNRVRTTTQQQQPTTNNQQPPPADRGAFAVCLQMGDVPLATASRFQNLSAAKRLILRGANMSLLTEDGKAPLELFEDTQATLAMLLGFDMSVDVVPFLMQPRILSQWEPLHHACAHNNLRLIITLVEAKANLATTDKEGKAAIEYLSTKDDSLNQLLEYFTEHLDVTTCSLLLEHGANVDRRLTVRSRVPSLAPIPVLTSMLSSCLVMVTQNGDSLLLRQVRECLRTGDPEKHHQKIVRTLLANGADYKFCNNVRSRIQRLYVRDRTCSLVRLFACLLACLVQQQSPASLIFAAEPAMIPLIVMLLHSATLRNRGTLDFSSCYLTSISHQVAKLLVQTQTSTTATLDFRNNQLRLLPHEFFASEKVRVMMITMRSTI